MQNQPSQEIKVQDNFPGAEYANAMQVSHNKEEFLLTFLNLVPPAGRVCGKILTSPGHMKRMVTALSENLARYEATFGKIEEAEAPKTEVGFKGE
jgi:hypothetical protein